MKTFKDYNESFDELAVAIHQSNVDAGWWEFDELPHDIMYTKLQLAVTEIAEATEGERKNLMDEHLPHREMGEVKLADAMIRLLDLAGLGSWAYHATVDPCPAIDMMENVAAKHLFICVEICDIGMSQDDNQRSYHYSTSINSILKVAEFMGYDVMGALFEKWEYNKHRADHKPENRAKENGKKF